MKKLLLLLSAIITSGIMGNTFSPTTFDRMFGINSPIFNLPLYYSTEHFEYDEILCGRRVCDDTCTKKCIIQSKTTTPPEPKKMNMKPRKNK